MYVPILIFYIKLEDKYQDVFKNSKDYELIKVLTSRHSNIILTAFFFFCIMTYDTDLISMQQKQKAIVVTQHPKEFCYT